MAKLSRIVILLSILGAAMATNNTEDSCGLQPWDEGPWGSLLEEWASTPVLNERQGRIMSLPPAPGYYITDRIGLAPPPPPQNNHPPVIPARLEVAPTSATHHNPAPPPSMSKHYEEWNMTPPAPAPGKILNRPPHKDQFKPSYPPPQPNYPQQRPQRPQNTIDRVDDPPRKQVTETDLFLLGAIEKLVYRADLMEKRLRKVEESLHFLVAGQEEQPEPCVANFTRIRNTCYHFSNEAVDWKSANLACRKFRSNLLELETEKEKTKLFAAIGASKKIAGTDWWTGGLNPGLLWIWSHSARPVLPNTTNSDNNSNTASKQTIVGEGRCLALIYDPTVRNYVYRGQDCALRHRYVCEKEEDKEKLGNEIVRAARKLRRGARDLKNLWIDEHDME